MNKENNKYESNSNESYIFLDVVKFSIRILVSIIVRQLFRAHC